PRLPPHIEITICQLKSHFGHNKPALLHPDDPVDRIPGDLLRIDGYVCKYGQIKNPLLVGTHKVIQPPRIYHTAFLYTHFAQDDAPAGGFITLQMEMTNDDLRRQAILHRCT